MGSTHERWGAKRCLRCVVVLHSGEDEVNKVRENALRTRAWMADDGAARCVGEG